MTEPVTPRSPLLRLWDYAARHRRATLLSAMWSVLNKLFDIAPELLIGVAVDVVVRGEGSVVSDVFGVEDRFHQLLVVGAINLVVWILESLTEYLAAIGWRSLAQTIEHEARMDAYAHVQRLEMGALEDRETGDLLAVLNDDVNQLERFLDVGANRLILTVMNVILVGIVFVVISPLLALLAFLPIPLIAFGSLAFQRRLEPLYAAVRARAGDVAGVLANNLAGLATIKSFTAEEREVDRIAAASQAYREANRDAIRVSSAFVPLIRMAILAGFTTTLIVGGKATLDGNLEVGAFSVLVFMTQRLLWPLTQLGEVLDLYQRGMASTRRILDLLDVPPRIVGGPGRLGAAGGGVRGEVELRGVRFAYHHVSPDAPEVLRGIDLHVPAGRDARDRRPDGGRQVHAGQAPAAPRGPDGRDHHDRRHAPARRLAWSPCAARWATSRRTSSCSAGPCATTSPTAGRARATRRSRRRWQPPRRWSSCARCPPASTRWWASAACA